jgi:hypothetical protein
MAVLHLIEVRLFIPEVRYYSEYPIPAFNARGVFYSNEIHSLKVKEFLHWRVEK